MSRSADAAGRAGFGGTAVAWDLTLGKSHKVRGTDHTHTGRTFQGGFAIWSCYGPSGRIDTAWMAATRAAIDETGFDSNIAVGDFNWNDRYEPVMED